MRGVIFDYGLTLVRFSFPEACLLAVLERFRPKLAEAARTEVPSAERLVEAVLMPLEEELQRFGEDEVDYMSVYTAAWQRAGLELPRDLLYELLDAEQLCWDEAATLVPGALETLDRLRRRGLKTAIASNAPFPPEMMHRQLRRNGLADAVDAAVFSSEVGKRKPAPELYLAALQMLDLSPAEALYVGDRVVEDYDGPRRVGMRAVLCGDAAPDEVPRIARLADVEAVL
jgi:HAD superfamily hydrolase (TIGR01549 family)